MKKILKNAKPCSNAPQRKNFKVQDLQNILIKKTETKFVFILRARGNACALEQGCQGSLIGHKKGLIFQTLDEQDLPNAYFFTSV